MKCKIKVCFILFTVLISISLMAVPTTINFQGALKDTNGVPVNDTKYLDFRIYDDPNTGTLLWSEGHTAVEIVDGIFSEELGGSSLFPSNLFDNPTLYITFYVGGAEMTPRQKLLAVPYTLLAENSNYIEDISLSGLVQQDLYGNATITGTMSAGSFIGDGSGLTNVGSFDDLYVNTTEPDSITVNSLTPALTIANSGIGDGLEITSAGEDGVYIYQAGNPTTQNDSPANNGVEVAGAEGHGLFVGRAESDGVHIHDTAYNGVTVNQTVNHGVAVVNAGEDGIAVTYAGDDGVSVYNAGNPSTQNSISAHNGFEVNGAEGNGLYVGRADINGVSIESTASNGVYVDNAANDGVRVYQAGNPSTQMTTTFSNGFEVNGAEGNGLYVGQADWNGAYINFAGNHGVLVSHAANDGIRVYQAGNASIQYASTYFNGFEVNGAEGHGLFVGQADENGVNVNSATHMGVYVGDGGDYGVWSNTSLIDGFGFYTNDKTYSGSGYYPARSGTFCLNTGSSTLEPGDMVCISGGYEENVLGEDGVPVLKIEKANSNNSESIFGVVESRVFVRIEEKETEDEKTEVQKSFRFTEGYVKSGDYLSVIVFGPVDVKVDSGESIKSGETLTAGNGFARKVRTTEVNGIVLAENVGILGKALEDSNGRGKIKVYVNCR